MDLNEFQELSLKRNLRDEDMHYLRLGSFKEKITPLFLFLILNCAKVPFDIC